MKRKKVYFDPLEEFLRTVTDEFVQRDRVGLRKESVWFPGVDVYEIEAGLIIVAELPGVKKENLEIHLEEGHLVIEGTRFEPVYQFVKCHHRESLYGNFRRSVRLPRKIDEEKVKAELRDGLLLVYLPIKESVAAKVRID